MRPMSAASRPESALPVNAYSFALVSPKAIDPHAREIRAPHARIRRADARVFTCDHEIAAERIIAAAAHAPAVHLRDYGLQRAPQAHEFLMRRERRRGRKGEVLAGVPLAVRVDKIVPVMEAFAEIVTGAKGAAGAAEHDHLDRLVKPPL